MKLKNAFILMMLSSIVTLGIHPSAKAGFFRKSNDEKCINCVNKVRKKHPLAAEKIIEASSIIDVGIKSIHTLQTLKVLISLYENYSQKNVNDNARVIMNSTFNELHKLCGEITEWADSPKKSVTILDTPKIRGKLSVIRSIYTILNDEKIRQNPKSPAIFSLFECDKNVINVLKNQVSIALPDTSWSTRTFQWIKPKILPTIFILSIAALYYQNPELVKSFPGYAWKFTKNAPSYFSQAWQTASRFYQAPLESSKDLFDSCSIGATQLLTLTRKTLVNKLNY